MSVCPPSSTSIKIKTSNIETYLKLGKRGEVKPEGEKTAFLPSVPSQFWRVLLLLRLRGVLPFPHVVPFRSGPSLVPSPFYAASWERGQVGRPRTGFPRVPRAPDLVMSLFPCGGESIVVWTPAVSSQLPGLFSWALKSGCYLSSG